MNRKHIAAIVFFALFGFMHAPANAGSLEPLADALEDMAEAGRAADRAQESMRHAMDGEYYPHQRRYYYRDRYDDYRKDWRKPPHPYWSRKYHKHHKHKWHHDD